MRHLIRLEDDCGVAPWCTSVYDSSTWKDTDKVDECDCFPCLDAVWLHGIAAMRRKLRLHDPRIADIDAKIEAIINGVIR
jgi:hypothetical protein